MKCKQFMVFSCIFLTMAFLLFCSQCSKKQQETPKPEVQGKQQPDTGTANKLPQNPPVAQPANPNTQPEPKSLEDQKKMMDDEIAKFRESIKGKDPGSDEYLDLNQKIKELEFKKTMMDYQKQMQAADPATRETIMAQVQPLRISFQIEMMINDLRNQDANRKQMAQKRLTDVTGQDLGQNYKDWSQWWDKNKDDFIKSGKWKNARPPSGPANR